MISFNTTLRKSAFRKLGLFILLILIVALLSLMFYITNNQKTAYNDSSSITATLTANAVIEKIDRLFFERYGDIQAFAMNEMLVSTAERDTVVPGAQDFMNAMVKFYRVYDIIILCNKYGQVLAVNSTDRNGKLISSESLIGKSFDDAEWMQACTSDKMRGAWFSDYGLDKSVQSIYRSHGNGVAFAAPVRNSFNDVVGVLYSFASWRETADIIRKGAEDILLQEHPEAFILITDRRHRIISAADSLLLGHSFTPAHHHEASQQTVGNVKTTEYVTGSAESGGVYTFRSNGWSTVTFIPRQFLSWSVLLSWKNLLALGLWIFVLAGLSTVVFVFFKRRILFRIDAIKEIQRRLSDGEILHIKEDIRHEDEFSTMTNSLALLAKRLTQKTIFSNEISKGNLAAQLEQVTEKDTLGNSLIHMRNQLLQTRDAEQHRNWTTEGMARIGVILRSFRSIEELHHDLVKFVVTYCGGNQGGLFLVTETDYNNEKEISLAACYAYGKKRIAEKRFPFGSGMIGQCMLEGDTIYMASVPSSYIRISSGLGEATPKTVLIVPLKTDAGVCGALELASFRKLEPHQINFVEQAAESIAAVLSTLGASEKMRMLFEQLQQQTEEMKSQEEEMRQNMEELTATQEEMQRKEIEYLDRIKKLEQSLAASVPQA